MAARKDHTADSLLSNEEHGASFAPKSPGSSSKHRRLPRQKNAVIIQALVYLIILIFAATTIYSDAKHVQRHCKSDLVPSDSKLLSINDCLVLDSTLSERGFRLHSHEAALLNTNESVRLEPGDDLRSDNRRSAQFTLLGKSPLGTASPGSIPLCRGTFGSSCCMRILISRMRLNRSLIRTGTMIVSHNDCPMKML